MQPLKVTIAGDFWDVQIYRGRLYLWSMEGAVRVYDWDPIVDSLASRSSSRLAAKIALARGDLLYGPRVADLVLEAEFEEFFRERFKLLAKDDFTLAPRDIRRFLISEQRNPFPELPVDSEIYKNVLYSVDYSGLWRAGVHRPSLKFGVSTRAEKVFDGHLFSVRARPGRLALAGGADGVLEYNLRLDEGWWVPPPDGLTVAGDDLRILSPRHCSKAEWAFSSIYCSSHESTDFLVGFAWTPRKAAARVPTVGPEDELVSAALTALAEDQLSYVGIFDESEILPAPRQKRASWAGQDKIYFSTNGTIVPVRFTQKNLVSKEDAFEGEEPVEFVSNANVVSGGVGYFGALVEDEQDLTVIESDGNRTVIKGPVTRWRVYPRSIRYENHLHVVLSDRVVIYSFNGDYFQDQDAKLFGMRFWESGGRRS